MKFRGTANCNEPNCGGKSRKNPSLKETCRRKQAGEKARLWVSGKNPPKKQTRQKQPTPKKKPQTKKKNPHPPKTTNHTPARKRSGWVQRIEASGKHSSKKPAERNLFHFENAIIASGLTSATKLGRRTLAQRGKDRFSSRKSEGGS